MKELRVLVINGKSVSFDSGTMAKAPELFMNLCTLCLERCFSTDIGLIGSMCNLEILSFNSTEKIDVLPSEIGQLKKLKLLDLRGCKVGLVESGVLSSLTKLEELYMGEYFRCRGVEELNNGNCARVTELYSLSCLRRLQLCVYKPLIMMLKDFPGEELTRFHFSMSRYSEERYYDFANEVDLFNVDLGKLSGSKFEALTRRAEVVSLRSVSGWKNIMRESDIDGYLNLRKLDIQYNNDLVEICDGNVPDGSMVKLEELRLSSLYAMKYIWRGRVHPPCLNNLKVFVIKECNAIQSLFSPSVVRCLLRLEVLEISYCGLLEEIISEDVVEEDENSNIITLPNLKNVKLDRLPRLGSYSGSIFNKVLLPSMDKLTLESIGGAVKVLNHEQIMYSCLKLQELKVRNCDAVEVLFDFQGADIPKQGFQGFHNLTKLDVYKCHKLRYLMSISRAKLLVNLQVINVRSCKLMEYVIMIEEEKESPQPQCEIERSTDKIVFPNLFEVNLQFLNNLKEFCQGGCDLQFPSLKKVLISRCLNIKKILSSESPTPNFEEVIFPSLETLSLVDMSTVKILRGEFQSGSLYNLRALQIRSCHLMEMLFDFKGVDVISAVHGEEVVVLGQLDTNEILNSNELREIWKNVPKQGFQSFHNLTKLDVTKCHKLRYLMSPFMAKLLVSLQVIKIGRCDNIQYVIMTTEIEESSDSETKKRMDKIVFPRLQELELEYLENLTAFCQRSYDLQFPSLKKVEIRECSNMKMRIFSSESLVHNFKEGVLLPSLETLTLNDMSAVKISVGVEIQSGSLNNLRALNIYECDSMETLFDLEGVDVISGEEVMVLAQLDTITIRSLYELREIWKNVPKQGFQGFHNLTVLDVYGCDKLRYLVSPCMAKLLVNLQVINVDRCEKMEEIIQRDDDEEEKNTIVFPGLREISLTGLSSLIAFHEGSCNFEFPLLNKLFIFKCDKMNKFCSSSVSQPKLQHIRFNFSSVPPMADVNTTIQKTIKRQAESSVRRIEDESD